MVARTDLRPTRADDSLKKLLNKVANPQTVPHGVKVAQPGEYVSFYDTDGTAHRWDGDAIAEYDARIAEGAAAVAAAQAHLAEVEAELADAQERITTSSGDLTQYAQQVADAQAAADAANAALDDLEASFDIVADKAKSFGFESGQRYYSPITYVWPDFYKEDSKWSEYLEFGHTLGLVIMNRSSGDWSVYDQDFHTQAQKAQSAGAKKILFYIKTLYGAATDPPKYAAEFNQPLTETEKYTHDYIVSTMKQVKAEYPDVFGGVFLDEAVNGWEDQAGRVGWYKELYQKLKVELGRQTVIVINPGANTVPEMMDACDIVMSYESTATKYIDPNNAWVHPDHYRQFPSWRFWHVIHDVVPEDIEKVFKKLDELGIGHAFITDRVLDLGGGDAFNPDIHPYDTPPSSWVVAQITSWIQGTLPFRRDIDAVRELASAPITVDRLVITEDLAARIVNAMSVNTKRLVVTESAILQHSTLLGETVAEQLNVTKTLVARDAIVNGTLDVEQLNVTGEMSAQIVSAMSLESKKLVVTEDAIINRATVVQSLVTPELVAQKISSALITGSTIQTSSTANQGVKIDSSGYKAYDSAGNLAVNLDGKNNRVVGSFATSYDDASGVKITQKSTAAAIDLYTPNWGGNASYRDSHAGIWFEVPSNLSNRKLNIIATDKKDSTRDDPGMLLWPGAGIGFQGRFISDSPAWKMGKLTSASLAPGASADWDIAFSTVMAGQQPAIFPMVTNGANAVLSYVVTQQSNFGFHLRVKNTDTFATGSVMVIWLAVGTSILNV